MSLLLASMALLAGAESFNADLEQFPIGIWNYAPIEVFDEDKVEEWHEAGLTLVMGPEYTATPENIVHMKRILTWADERDIDVIVCDPRTRARATLGEDYAKQAAQATADFAQYDNVFGFHILDEPGTDLFKPTCEAVRIVKEAAPDRQPFVNLLPWYMGVSQRVGYDNWQEYLDAFLAESGMAFLCYDCYAQMNPGQSGWPMYFRNLREYGEAARRNDVPFWTTILSVGHFHYRCPNEDEIRWQFNSAVAYGAQGILYFFFYMRHPHANYRLSPLDSFYEKTPTFGYVKRTNKRFLTRFGRLFLDLTLEKAMQYPEPVEGCEPFAPDDILHDVRTDGNRAVIVSRFRDKEGRPWVAIVNNSTEESTMATLFFKGANTQVTTVNWQAQEQPAGVERASDHVRVSHWLAPGQIEVYRIDPKP